MKLLTEGKVNIVKKEFSIPGDWDELRNVLKIWLSEGILSKDLNKGDICTQRSLPWWCLLDWSLLCSTGSAISQTHSFKIEVKFLVICTSMAIQYKFSSYFLFRFRFRRAQYLFGISLICFTLSYSIANRILIQEHRISE